MSQSRDRVPSVARGGASSREVAYRFRRGDPDAVASVRRRVGRILGYRGLRIPRHERDDLEQEIMTELWRAVNGSGFDCSGGFWGFVEVVTGRRAIDWRRARKEFEPLDEDLRDGGEGPLDGLLAEERSDLAARLLASLDGPCRELLRMRLVEEMSYREIAETCGRSEGALRVQMYRCVGSAREALGKLRDAGSLRTGEEDAR